MEGLAEKFGDEANKKPYKTIAACARKSFNELFWNEACLGQVSEIFDGDSPHTPRGCVAQAWSVAELLRAAVEDVYMRESVSQAVGAS